jgi:hypothetical protein
MNVLLMNRGGWSGKILKKEKKGISKFERESEGPANCSFFIANSGL